MAYSPLSPDEKNLRTRLWCQNVSSHLRKGTITTAVLTTVGSGDDFNEKPSQRNKYHDISKKYANMISRISQQDDIEIAKDAARLGLHTRDDQDRVSTWKRDASPRISRRYSNDWKSQQKKSPHNDTADTLKAEHNGKRKDSFISLPRWRLRLSERHSYSETRIAKTEKCSTSNREYSPRAITKRCVVCTI